MFAGSSAKSGYVTATDDNGCGEGACMGYVRFCHANYWLINPLGIDRRSCRELRFAGYRRSFFHRFRQRSQLRRAFICQVHPPRRSWTSPRLPARFFVQAADEQRKVAGLIIPVNEPMRRNNVDSKFEMRDLYAYAQLRNAAYLSGWNEGWCPAAAAAAVATARYFSRT